MEEEKDMEDMEEGMEEPRERIRFRVLSGEGYLIHNPLQTLESIHPNEGVIGESTIDWSFAFDAFSSNSPIFLYRTEDPEIQYYEFSKSPSDFYTVEPCEVVPTFAELPFGYGVSHPMVIPLEVAQARVPQRSVFHSQAQGTLVIHLPRNVQYGRFVFAYFTVVP